MDLQVATWVMTKEIENENFNDWISHSGDDEWTT